MIYWIFFYVKIYLETTKHQNEKETERGYEMKLQESVKNI